MLKKTRILAPGTQRMSIFEKQKTTDMETVKIHYLGFGVQELHTGATIMDAVWHLGAKYGAIAYNKGIKSRAIQVYENNNLILVRPDMAEVYESVTAI